MLPTRSFTSTTRFLWFILFWGPLERWHRHHLFISISPSSPDQIWFHRIIFLYLSNPQGLLLLFYIFRTTAHLHHLPAIEKMKAEYNGDRHEPNSTMFSKLQPHHPFSHHFHLSSDPQPSDDDVATSRISTAPFFSQDINAAADGATVEAPLRKRGRPPGSKNKPKQQFGVTTRESEPSDMSPYILEVGAGDDVVEAVSRFSRRKGTGLCILSASGTVANFSLRQPAISASSPPTLTFHGRYISRVRESNLFGIYSQHINNHHKI